MPRFEPLGWDTEFFGFGVARLDPAHLDAATLAEARRAGIALAYLAVPDVPASLPDAAIRALGGALVDHKTTFLKPSTDRPAALPVRPVQAADSRDALRALAVQSAGHSRYAVDARIPPGKLEQLYHIWIDRSVAREIADEVLVVEVDRAIAGMVTLGRKQGRGDIGLVAVDARHRGQGLGAVLVDAASAWFHARGEPAVQVVTQGANEAACRLYRRCGFVVERVERFYHFWL